MSRAQSGSPSVLIVRLDAIGDALTLVPALAALRRHNLRVGAVLRPANAQVFSREALDAVHVAGTVPDTDLLRDIRAQHYDAALIPTEKPEGYRLPYAARIPRRIGFENGWGKPLKTLWVRRLCTRTLFRTAGLDVRAPHECDVVFSLVQTIVDEPEPPRDPNVLRRFVIDTQPPPDSRIAVQITSKWTRLGATPRDVLQLVERIASRRKVRFIAASSEGDCVREFAGVTGYSVDTFDTLPPWKEAIAAARALVAPDSGAVHVAGMIGTPVVSCFARENFALQARRWAPWAAAHRVVGMEAAWPLVAADALEDLLMGKAPFSYTG